VQRRWAVVVGLSGYSRMSGVLISERALRAALEVGMTALCRHEVVAVQRRVSGMCFLLLVSDRIPKDAYCKQSHHVSSPHQVDCPGLFYAFGCSISKKGFPDSYHSSLRMWSWQLVLLCPFGCSIDEGRDRGLLMRATARRGRRRLMLMARHQWSVCA
jgi:hypothetical protein